MWIFLGRRDIIRVGDEYLVGLNRPHGRWISFLKGDVGIGQTKQDFRVVRRKISQENIEDSKNRPLYTNP